MGLSRWRGGTGLSFLLASFLQWSQFPSSPSTPVKVRPGGIRPRFIIIIADQPATSSPNSFSHGVYCTHRTASQVAANKKKRKKKKKRNEDTALTPRNSQHAPPPPSPLLPCSAPSRVPSLACFPVSRPPVEMTRRGPCGYVPSYRDCAGWSAGGLSTSIPSWRVHPPSLAGFVPRGLLRCLGLRRRRGGGRRNGVQRSGLVGGSLRRN